jgi:hypothetical protein
MTRKTKVQLEAEDLFWEFGFGSMYGLIMGIANAEAMAQILGKPHEKGACLAGERCAIHGTPITTQSPKEEEK